MTITQGTAVRAAAAELPVYGREARELIEGQPVLVTGAGGSIGSELVRQLTILGASQVTCVDRDEYALYRLQLEMTGQALLTDAHIILADVADRPQLTRVMTEHRPALVFHAAACKHLPLLERSPAQAIVTNVEGTANVTAAAAAAGVRRLVNISTDKAASPVSVLGQTKALAEAAVLHHAGSSMLAASVRFGNVYGSRGSFIETLAWQLARKLPVTITDPGMTRYFMTVSQAAGLVIQAAVFADSKSTFVLDMGEPHLIADVIRDYAAAACLPVPRITVTGSRPGEKITEILASDTEIPSQTSHPLITAIRSLDHATAGGIAQLIAAARRGDGPDKLHSALARLTTPVLSVGACA